MTQRSKLRAGVGVAVLAAVALGCTVPKPLTYPLTLTPPRDATSEVQTHAGTAPAFTAVGRARVVAASMSGVEPGCEVFRIAQVMWVSGGAPARAAIELRGFCDDSVQGAWYELTLEGDDQLGWVVASATKSDICARGLSGTLCV
jgi:hypothetical protein